MATKGASNRYGAGRGSRQHKPTEHTGFGWAKEFNKNTLQDHFNRHGSQMGCHNKDAYEAHAVKFANTVDRKNCVSFIDKNNSTYKYNKKTNEFAIITKDGFVVTYYSPKGGYDYYKAQERKWKNVK